MLRQVSLAILGPGTVRYRSTGKGLRPVRHLGRPLTFRRTRQFNGTRRPTNNTVKILGRTTAHLRVTPRVLSGIINLIKLMFPHRNLNRMTILFLGLVRQQRRNVWGIRRNGRIRNITTKNRVRRRPVHLTVTRGSLGFRRHRRFVRPQPTRFPGKTRIFSNRGTAPLCRRLWGVTMINPGFLRRNSHVRHPRPRVKRVHRKA